MEMIDIAAAVSLPQVSVDSTSSSSWSPLYGGGAHLDQEAIQYIHKFYCKDCRMEAEKAKAAAAEGTSPKEGEEEKPTSPLSTLEEMSLQQSMDKNKESLKRKLMMRRSVNELVDQGIYPPLKTPPAFAEQRKSLERAKTGDLLRYKISHRPDRQQLVQQHILEDTKIDPSLHERQRLLKRARLVDDLNDKLNHRPGPLDLMKGNILKTEDDKFMEAFQDGALPYAPKDEDNLFPLDDDSNTSEGAYSPSHGEDSGMSDIGSPPIIPQAPSPPNQFKQQKIFQASNFQANVNKLPVVTTQTFSISNPSSIITSVGNYSLGHVKNGNSNNFVTKVRPKKSNRPKTQAKSKVIKFHEYKGPPNVVKSTNPTATAAQQPDKNETPYHILLQQQQLFLQWQLEFNSSPPIGVNKLENKFEKTSMIITSSATTSPINVMSPTLISSSQGQVQTSQQTITSPTSLGQPQLASQGNILTTSMPAIPSVQTKLPSPTVVQSSPSPICQPQVQLNMNKPLSKVVTQKPLANLEDMKVADLKAELKKRNLPVSGPKPQLIERLKPYADTIITNNSNLISKNISALSKLPVQAIVNVKKFPVVKSDDIAMSSSSPTSPRSLESLMPLSPEIMEMVTSPQSSIINSQPVNNISASQGSIPMAVDNSRPPSVVPMDMAMDVDQPVDSSNLIQQSFNQASLSPSSSTITLVTSPAQQQLQIIQTPLEQPQSQQIQIVQQPQPQQSPTAKPQQAEPLTPEQLIREEMLQQQRNKISELQRQLEESQRRLKLQQMQHQHLQQQQQQLNQLQQQTAQLNQLQQQTQLLQQPTSPPMAVSSQMTQQPTSPPMVVSASMSPQPVSNPLTVKTNLIQPASPSQSVNSGVPSPASQILSVAQPVSEGTTTILQIPLNALQNATQMNAIKTTTVQPANVITNSNINSQVPKVTNLFTGQTLHQSLNLGNPNTSMSSLINIQPLNTGTGKAVNLPPLNGLTQQQQQRAISVPSSPVEGKTNISRAKSNPFFIPSKEPPKYDEAVKNMHNLTQGVHILKTEPGVIPTTTQSMTKSISTPVIKSQTMDDVLEILIRNGELPPSAAQEPPPTPKTTPQSVSTSTINSATSSFGEFSSSAGGHFPQFTMTLASTMPITSTTNVTDVVSSLLNSTPLLSHVKNEPITPPASVAMTTTSDVSAADILDINEMLNQDLSSMDWTSDSPFTQLDLNEGTCLPSDIDKNNQSKDFLDVPSPGDNVTNKGNAHGSEPDITGLGINDLENSQNINMQMDVSDWLDVIMPSTGLTPLSANAPMAFPSDPILTPKTQQEVFDLFNFEDTDFSQAEMQSGLNWEKLTETNIN